VLSANPPTGRRVLVVTLLSFAGLAAAVVCGLAVGPTSISTTRVIGGLFGGLGIGHSTLTPLQTTIVWQLRAPRLVLGLLTGAMLSVAGGAYQGVFRNPLADPYLLGVASGAGLGATFAIVYVGHGLTTPSWTPLLAFLGATGAVLLTWGLGGRGLRSTASTLILSGVAISALLTSLQTFFQQQSSIDSIARVYIWLLGSLATASWSSVWMVMPYVLLCLVICVAAGSALDVMSVGDEEARSLGLPVRKVRLVVVVASSLGTAAVVSAVGLIGFVGIIVPHILRLLVGTSYRRILPLSVIFGAAFLVLADTIARTVMAPTELPLGVVTAIVGAPVFAVILTLRRQLST
jgi:iron complex transport system permease protein